MSKSSNNILLLLTAQLLLLVISLHANKIPIVIGVDGGTESIRYAKISINLMMLFNLFRESYFQFFYI